MNIPEPDSLASAWPAFSGSASVWHSQVSVASKNALLISQGLDVSSVVVFQDTAQTAPPSCMIHPRQPQVCATRKSRTKQPARMPLPSSLCPTPDFLGIDSHPLQSLPVRNSCGLFIFQKAHLNWPFVWCCCDCSPAHLPGRKHH